MFLPSVDSMPPTMPPSPIVAQRRVALLAALAVLTGCAGGGPKPATVGASTASAMTGFPANAGDANANAMTGGAADSGDGAATAAEADRVPLTPGPAEVPEAAVAAYARATAAMSASNWIEAQAALEGFVLEYPGYPGPYVNLAIVYRRAGRDADAENALSYALELEPGHPAANNELGILLRERGEFAEAEAAYRRALDADPNYGLAHYNLAVLLDLYLRREADALDHYESYQALSAEPGDEVEFWVVDLRRRLGLPAERVAQEDRP